jgi:Leucine-rich repeat (LRR) protein
VPPKPAPVPVATKAVSLWPVPVRVMTWTPEGIVQIGELPDAPPPQPIATPWFVEPEHELNATTFARLIVALRSEHVPGLSLRGQPIARLDLLVDLPDLTALVLDDAPVEDAALDALDLPLVRLYLARTAVTDAGIRRVVEREPALQVLDIEGCAIGNEGVGAIAQLAELRALDAADTKLDDNGGVTLGALTRLEVLDLGHTKIAARTIAAIRPLALRELFLPSTRVGKEIATLAGYAPGLVRFDVSTLASGYKPSDADLAWLATAPHLVEAGLSGAGVHDELVEAIVALPELRELRVASTPITFAAIRAIAARTEWREIDLAETPVDDATAAALVAMPALRMLRIDGTAIDDAAFATANPGANLRELYVSSTAITDTGTVILDKLPELIALGLGATKIGDATIARIGRLVELRTLVLAKTRTGPLDALANLHALERLYLTDTGADDATARAIASATKLRVLHIDETNVSAEGLPALQTLVRLEELVIGDTRVGAEITRLDAWPALRTLSLVGLDLNDSTLAGIAAQPSLVALDLSATSIGDPAPLAALPHLEVLGLAQTKLSKQGDASVKALAARGVEIRR